jgi:GNAT superfamily N-acetyltransferase
MIRSATKSDVSVLVELIHDLADYERAGGEVEITEAALDHALFGVEPGLFARLWTSESVVVGMALYHRSFSTWTGRPGIYLEDLYVRPSHRGRGIGRSLLVELAKIALDSGCRRVEWSVLDWNESAITFYRSIGAIPLQEWTRYRLAGQALEAFANSTNGGT